MSPLEKLKQAETLLREAYNEASQLYPTLHDRSRGQLLSCVHKTLSKLGDASQFYSQHGQDRYVDNVLSGKTHGVFVDIGGYDGFDGSNTLFFEQFRHWKGLLIEPCIPHLKTARSFRTCPCLGVGLGRENSTAEFLEVTQGFLQMSGFLDSYDPDTLEFVRKDPRHEETIHQLSVRTLDSVLTEHGFSAIDYISLDVEGGEFAILEAFPFEKYDIHLWSIENLTASSDIHDIMTSQGYDLVEFMGHDEIYKKREQKKTEKQNK